MIERWLLALSFLVVPIASLAEEASSATNGAMVSSDEAGATVRAANAAALDRPLVERYVLDELKALRTEQERLRGTLDRRLAAAQLQVADRSISYVADAITYFFYVIAAASSVIVFVGWRSLGDVRSSVGELARAHLSQLAERYEDRLGDVERALETRAREIEANEAKLERARAAHSLWLKASQEHAPQNKIAIYDQILELDPRDTEALTYKADAALLLDEARWAESLCQRALEIDAENGFALYQRACAHASLGEVDAALEDLERAIAQAPAFRDDARSDAAFQVIRGEAAFQALIGTEAVILAPDDAPAAVRALGA